MESVNSKINFTDKMVVVDSREQKPLWKSEVTRKGLKTGDYSILNYEDQIAIERKSAIDLFCTLGKGHKRFREELERAKALDYFAIIIEESYLNCLHKTFIGAHHSCMKGETVMAILFSLHIKYGIKVFFTNNRLESQTLIKEIFKSFLKNKIHL
jgi:DNA excision repair protein ERCC-4